MYWDRGALMTGYVQWQNWLWQCDIELRCPCPCPVSVSMSASMSMSVSMSKSISVSVSIYICVFVRVRVRLHFQFFLMFYILCSCSCSCIFDHYPQRAPAKKSANYRSCATGFATFCLLVQTRSIQMLCWHRNRFYNPFVMVSLSYEKNPRDNPTFQ
jgi:hypothetical protein